MRYKPASIKKGGTCDEAIVEFVEIFNSGQAFYSLYKSLLTKGLFEKVERQWDAFLDQSKYQTLLELTFNGWIYKNSESAYFMRPPSGQWILLPPGIVIECVSDAAGGAKSQKTLALDVFGCNNWTQDKWYIPSGVSYTILYSDRADVQNVGNAVSIHSIVNTCSDIRNTVLVRAGFFRSIYSNS